MVVTSYEPEQVDMLSNHTPSGELVAKQHCIRTIHAEQNLLLFTDQSDRDGASVYVTDQPCWACSNMLANSGVSEIIYHRPYVKDSDKVKALMESKGIVIRQLESYVPPFGTNGVIVD